jgi:hypothetical protein
MLRARALAGRSVSIMPHRISSIGPASSPVRESRAPPQGRPLAALAPEHKRWIELQRGIGNQAVLRLLQRWATAQTSLRINDPGDVYEQEADRIAEQVVQGPAQACLTPAPPGIQRTTGEPANQTGAAPASVDLSLASSGMPLDATLRQEMEQRFGRDFSLVRVHSGAAADRSTRDLNAKAYTAGNNIVFGAGQFTPESYEGRRLIAHELTHVVQQSSMPLLRPRQHSGNEPGTQHGGALLARQFANVVPQGSSSIPSSGALAQQSRPDAAPHRAERVPQPAFLPAAPVAGVVQRKPDANEGDVSPVLEVYPTEIRFEPTKIGHGTYRQVSIRNLTNAPVTFGGFYGTSSAPAAAAPAPPAKGKRAPAPIREAPKPLGARYAYSGPFKVIDDPDQRIVAAGGSIDVWVDFVPTAAGTKTDMFYVLATNGDAIARFTVVGEGIEQEAKQESDPGREPKAPPPTAAKDPAANAARQTALADLGKWQQEADHAIIENHNKMISEWTKYLSRTSSNPSLSSASVPGPSFLAELAEHTVAGLAARKAEHLIEHTAKHLAAEGVKTAVAGAAGAEVGSIAGPPGALIGFAVGVLIETVCAILYRWVSGEDAEIRHALQEAYASGWSEGSRKLGDLLEQKKKELDRTETKALAYQGAQRGRYEKLITKANDARQLLRLIAEIEAQTDLAKEAKPGEGFADALLELWVREYAAGPSRPTKEVNEKQWEKVAEEVEEKRAKPEAIDSSLKQPDLFLTQCLHEWVRRGLGPPPELKTRLLGELAELGIVRTTTSQAEPRTRLSELAEKVRKRFDRREFVWTNVFDLIDSGFILQAKTSWKRGEPEPHVPRYTGERSIPLARKDDKGQWITEGEVNMVDEVLCYPILATDGAGSCYVDRFDYRMKAYGKNISVSTSPGSEWGPSSVVPIGGYDPTASTGPKAQQAASAALYDLISKLGGFGLTVTAEPDADQNKWLQSTFGADVAVQKSQRAGGSPQAIKVFRLQEIIVIPTEVQAGLSQRTLPDEVWAQINRSFENFWQGRYLMVRGGDTILIIET